MTWKPGDVRAKKFLGQHFLNDEDTAQAIVEALELPDGVKDVLEIGPGMGVLTKYLLSNKAYTTHAVELDRDSIPYLNLHFPELKDRLIEGDFLHMNLDDLFENQFAIIGNFPYNISTQILFRILEFKNKVPLMVGMFQKEVAERIASPPGNRDYGILSVLLQPWFDIEYLFTVDQHLFTPPPRVKSAILRMKRNDRMTMRVDQAWFTTVVKVGFNQRRKTLRNALRPILPPDFSQIPYLDLRAEALSWQMFEELAVLLKAK
ncbi:MAG: 16S rRNA (adenine(1518)-N(6)/adenine(1519)-N(6))-dimethyltransferase RsmA [Bacteroidia bacterium]|nr:16S rRNA (adenine(1518)-N(6)/adenine(1519)-N(6))-dimethyltransferase RsmA [Bacteroidia bacterium]MBP7244375.1 16S rRNA (adenine(1518)-N(6)/adenine(1519)-N(6))-dimethyltransferase RsmA [Bacteroidia bacterium]